MQRLINSLVGIVVVLRAASSACVLAVMMTSTLSASSSAAISTKRVGSDPAVTGSDDNPENMTSTRRGLSARWLRQQEGSDENNYEHDDY
jgi:hypothetical protein